MEHTKGEWIHNGLTINSFGRGIIASCPTPNNSGVFECTANAKLIASAPKLLADNQSKDALLKELAEALKSTRLLNLHLYDEGTVGNRVFNITEAALKKVKP